MKKLSFVFPIILFISACSIEPATFKSITNPSLENISSAPAFKMNVNLYNPNHFGVKLKSYDLNVSVDSIRVANLSQDLAMHIPADTDFSIPVKINIPLTSLVKMIPQGADLFLNDVAIPFHLDGTITIKKFIFSKTYPVHLIQNVSKKDIGF